jgi:aminoglycoside phosphotransferase
MDDVDLIEYIKSILPSEIRSVVSQNSWQIITTGRSGDLCFRVQTNSGDTCYLKSYFGIGRETQYEMSVSTWLNQYLPAATVNCSGMSEDLSHQFILWNEIKGEPLHSLVGNLSPEQIVKIAALSVRQLHQINTQDCPFDQRLEIKIGKALLNATQGLVRLDDLDAIRKGWNIEQLKNELRTTKPKNEDVVFTHGDYCLPNLIVKDESLAGFIDFGRAGMADRHQDIALCLKSLQSNLGDSHEALFLEHYGLISELNQEKIEFYQLMDEFF